MVKTPGSIGRNKTEIIRYFNGIKYYLMESESYHHIHAAQSNSHTQYHGWKKKGK
jgi:hypothetical protein